MPELFLNVFTGWNAWNHIFTHPPKKETQEDSNPFACSYMPGTRVRGYAGTRVHGYTGLPA